MLFIWIDKFSLLSFQHRVDFILKIVCITIEIFDQILYFFDIVLNKQSSTLYL